MTALEAQHAQQQRPQLAQPQPPAASRLAPAPAPAPALLSKARMLLEGTRVRLTAFMVSRTSTRTREESTWHERELVAGAASRNRSSKSLVMKPTAWEASFPPRYSGKVAARSLVAIMVSKRSFLFSSRKKGVRANAGCLWVAGGRSGEAASGRAGAAAQGIGARAPERREQRAERDHGGAKRRGGAAGRRGCAVSSRHTRRAHATTSAKSERDSRILFVDASS